MNLDTLFAEALAQPDADREAYLDAHAPDETIRKQLRRLLGAHLKAGKFLAGLPDTPAGAADTHPPECPPDGDALPPGLLGGRYRATGVLGRGGMGIVYRAEQVEPIRRAVAVKVVRPGAASELVLGRFEAERQTVAAMSHPHIAAVYDGGSTPDGRPFFVMELVDGGVAITQYCVEHSLAFADRLTLFLDVCDAVQHAHQRGVLHRDLKPGNVLVARVEGRATAKVIDFGVAKAIAAGPEPGTHTRPGTLIGTPEYMSPEQADLSSRDIDVRSDVYALAVLLYELVVGDTPIPRERVKGSALLDVLQAVRDEEPPPVGAKRRGLPVELDWIVAKGLRKHRDHRYPSVAAFADDLRRMARHEAVTAAPTGGWYRVRKFARRNWMAVSAAAAVFAALAAGTVGTTVGMLRAQDAERVAEARRVEAEIAKDRESEQLRQAEIVVGILESSFANLHSSGRAGDLRQTLLRRLGEAERQIDADVAANPTARLRLKYTIAHVYLGMDEPRKAEPLFRSLADETVVHFGEDHDTTWRVKTSHANALGSLGRYTEAGERYAALRLRMEPVLGPAHRDVLNVRFQYAIAVSRTESWADALPLLERVHADAERHLGGDHKITRWTRLGLAGAYFHCKRSADGMAVLDEVLTAADSEERLTEWGVEAYQTAFATYVAKKQPEKCLPILRRIIAYYRADSPEHISHRRYVAQLRLVYKQMGDPENEEQVLLQLLDLCRKYDGEKSLNVADTLHSLGECRLGQQKFGPAAEVLQDALRLRLELKPDGWSQFDTRRRLGEARLGMKEFSEAERQLLQAHEGLTEHRPKVGRAIDAPVAHARQLLGELYAATGRPDEAARWKGSPPSVGK